MFAAHTPHRTHKETHTTLQSFQITKTTHFCDNLRCCTLSTEYRNRLQLQLAAVLFEINTTPDDPACAHKESSLSAVFKLL